MASLAHTHVAAGDSNLVQVALVFDDSPFPAQAQKILTATTCFTPKWYWPPFVESNDRACATAAKVGLEVYSLKQVVVSQDYDRSVGAEEIRRKATTNVKDGSVILFHEWRVETYEQLPAIPAELRRQGCVFLTFSELVAHVRSRNQSAPPP